MSTTTTYTIASQARALLSRGTADEPKRPIPTIDELIKRRAVELHDAPLIGYPRQGTVDFEEHGARAIDRYADAAVVKLQHLGFKAVVCHHFLFFGTELPSQRVFTLVNHCIVTPNC